MAQLQIAYLPRPGTQERWRRLCQELLAGSRRDRFAAFCQQAGITQMQLQLVQLLHGELLLLTVQTQEPHQTLEALANSKRQFDHWLREQFQVLLGWNVQDALGGLSEPQGDLIFTWPGECECDEEWASAPLARRQEAQEQQEQQEQQAIRASSSPEVGDAGIP